jgi:aspartyl-tRNA(Asn)/glutamyl-tRNA(Gln) amidotransferase subunit C
MLLTNRHGGGAVAALHKLGGVIDRQQVLHVAKLARLKLTDEEVERMSGELSTILENIEKIGELDLEGVEPTSHVVNVENVLRPDEPRDSLPRERALDVAPDATDAGFRVPSPGA